MKKAIFNLCIGGVRPHWQKCLQSQHAYCEKYGIQHFMSHQMSTAWPYGPNPTANFFFEKLQIRQLFSQDFDQVLYLDADILITPDAKNIFEEYPDPGKYYGYDESQEVGIRGKTLYGEEEDVMDRDPYVKRVIENLNEPFSWKKNERGKHVYYNMGVMLFGSESSGWIMDEEKLLSLKDCQHIYDFNDQTYFNALIQKYNIPNESLDHSFNRISLGADDPDNHRYKANFIHYAGPCLYGIEGKFTEEGKVNAVSKDYNYFYEN